MSNWKEYKVEEFAEVIGGGTPSTKNPDYFGGSIPWITPKDLTNYEKKFIKNGDRNITKEGLSNSSAKLIPKNSILLTSRAPIGYLAIAENDVTTNQGFKSIVVNPNIADFNFVYYLIKANIERIKGYGTGTTFAEVSATVVKNLKFNLPDLPTQTAIAEILSSLDDKIELNNKINQELENLAQTLFKQWFIDFEFPNEYGEPYKSSGGEMVDSELGEIPKEWEVKSLDEIADYLNGLALQKFPAQDDKDYLPVIKIRELRQGISQASDKASTEVPDKYIIQNGDVLFAWSGSLMIDFWTNGEGALNQHLFKVTSENYPKWFYFYWTKYHLDEFIKIAESKATTMGHIQRKHLTEAKVTVPNSNHLNQFNDNFENIVESIISNREENQELTNLRDTLLPKLISGELEVAEVMTEKA
jgi:type I restriction enzyme, S subunit